jgi:molybdopterin synthase catalytic subunit
MQPLGLVGPGAGAVLDRLVERLDGRVATVESLPDADAGGVETPAVAASYGLTGEGSWVAAGERLSVGDLLDDLAPTYDYVVLVGFPDAAVPTVTVGDDVAVPDRLLHADAPEAVDLDAVLEALAERQPHVTLSTLVERVKASSLAERAGAVATFTGRVRAKDGPDDDRTEHLEFESYAAVAAERMAAIEADLEAREGVLEVAMHHRVGRVDAGEDIVFVVVLAGHREEAFRAVEDGIDRLKEEVPIFKRETTEREEFWLHERE